MLLTYSVLCGKKTVFQNLYLRSQNRLDTPDVPCINDEKPSAADGALPGSIAHTKHLEPVGTVSPSRKTDGRPRKGKNI